MIWGNISRSVNGENALGGVAYKNKHNYTDDMLLMAETETMAETDHEKRALVFLLENLGFIKVSLDPKTTDRPAGSHDQLHIHGDQSAWREDQTHSPIQAIDLSCLLGKLNDARQAIPPSFTGICNIHCIPDWGEMGMGLLSPCPPVSTSNRGASMVAITPYQMEWEVPPGEEGRPGDSDRCLNHMLEQVWGDSMSLKNYITSCGHRHINLQATHLAGVENITADEESWVMKDGSDRMLCSTSGSVLNPNQLRDYVSWRPDEAWTIDAFTLLTGNSFGGMQTHHGTRWAEFWLKSGTRKQAYAN